MSVKVRWYNGAWYMLIDHRGRRKAKKLGKTELRGLSRQHIRTAVRAFFREGLANSSIRCFLNVLQSCLSAAVEEGHLAHNPAEQPTKWLLRSTATQRKAQASQVFTAPEIKLLLERAAAQGALTHIMSLTLLRNGLHISELIGLRVEDLDFERREIHVRRTWGNTPRGPDYYGVPKSGQQRLVDMSLKLKDALQRWVATLPHEEGWLFSAKHGLPMQPNNFYGMHWWPLFVDADPPAQMRRALSGGLIPYRKPHMSRHTHATHLLWQDESPVYVKERLGHSSIRITVDVYGSSIRRDNKRAVGHLDDAVEAAKDIRKPDASDLGTACASFREGGNKCRKNRSLSTATSGEGRATKRWSIYRKRASNLPRRMLPTTPKPCRN